MTVGLGPLNVVLTHFYRADFSFHHAQWLLGEPAQEQTNPHNIVLVPFPHLNADEIELEKLQLDSRPEIILAGILVSFKKPPMLDFVKLGEVFGQPRELPMVGPGSPLPFGFKFLE